MNESFDCVKQMSETNSKSAKSLTQTTTTTTTLPLSRVNTIMRSSPDVSSLSSDSVELMRYSTQLFIKQLTLDAYNNCCDKSKLDYNDMSTVVLTQPRLAFLHDIIPNKIKVKDYFKLLDKQESVFHNNSDSCEEKRDDIEIESGNETDF